MINVGVLGATGAVGQRFVQLLANHPWFNLECVMASERSAGKEYRNAVNWRLDTPMPENIGSLKVKPVGVESSKGLDIVFSALPADLATTVERDIANAGVCVCSNASSHGKVVIAGAELYNAIKAASLVSDKIAFGINPDNETFYMEADGDTDHINLEIKAADLKTFIPAEARSLFSLDYLKDMGRVMSKAEEVEIFLGKDHPVKFVFTIAGGEGKVEYLLAPRIESD